MFGIDSPMLWNFLITKFQEKLHKGLFSGKVLDLMDIMLIMIDRDQMDNRTIQKFDATGISLFLTHL